MIKKYFKNMEFDKNVFIIYLRFIIGAIFIYASLDKIADPQSFSNIISSYQFSSLIGLSALDNSLALVLPWLEFIIGACLILGIYIDEVINIIIILLLLFIIVLSQAYFRGIILNDCGCGLNESSIGMDIVRDFILLFASLAIKFRRFYVGTKYRFEN